MGKSLACVLKGHTPPEVFEEVAYDITEGNCIYCGQLLHRSKMWAGMKWRYWWTPVEE